MEIIISIWIISLIAGVYFMIRNQWVYDKRIGLTGTEDRRKLPTYEYMLFKRPFCWNINKFIDDNNGKNKDR